jgi:hypothetical protein
MMLVIEPEGLHVTSGPRHMMLSAKEARSLRRLVPGLIES